MERRRFKRAEQRLEAIYSIVGDLYQAPQNGWSDDIGIGGIRLNLVDALPVGQRIKFSVRRARNSCWSPEIDGIVAWRRPCEQPSGAGNATGIHFSSDQVLVNKYLDDLFSVGAHQDFAPQIDLQIEPAYDGSKITYRFLRLFGWGPLNNMGFFQFGSPFECLNLLASLLKGTSVFLLPEAQRRLVIHSAKLLNIQKGNKILDVACGKGMGSFLIANQYPEAIVTGIDILPGNISAARALHGGVYNLRFLTDNAMELGFGDGTMDKMLCVEAAFHFPNREKFLAEAYRVLKPGGKVTIVDFMWKSDRSRLVCDVQKVNLVKNEWQWDDFFSIDQYVDVARNVGFDIQNRLDWSPHVIGPVEFIFKIFAQLSGTRWGRKFLTRINPLLRSITDEDWKLFQGLASAHIHVKKHVEYVALVLVKCR